MIELDKVNISYDNELILSSISISFSNYKSIGIWGSNGIGKSSILKAIAGISTAQITGDAKIQSNMVAINQNPLDLILPWYSSIKNIELFTNSNSENCKKILNDFNIVEKDWLKKAIQLSGGTQQRLAWACFLSASYDTILLDEPFSKQDRLNKKILLKLLYKKIFHENKNMLLVSHDPVSMIKLCEVILIIDKVKEENHATIVDRLNINLTDNQRKDDKYVHNCKYIELLLKSR